MPRFRLRAQALNALKKINNKRRQDKLVREVLLDSDDHVSRSDDDSSVEEIDDDEFLLVEEMKDVQLIALENAVKGMRYLFREKSYRNRREVFNLEDTLSHDSVLFNDEEFLKNFRISRYSFHWLLQLFIDSPELASVGTKERLPPALHLLLFLKKVGSEGVSANDSQLAQFFGIGKGTVPIMFRRMKSAILSLKEDVISWPTAEEKEIMKLEIKAKYGFQKCIGIIDGTIIILSQRPDRYGDSYWCRKCCYSLNVQVICDNKRKVLYYYGGWPGSVYDNRAWKNCRIFKSASTYFGEGEYLVGDCAYSKCNVMVQTFKKLPGISNLTQEQEFFNTRLGSLRVKSEHCIGILKNRFPMIRRTNARIRDQHDVMEVMDVFGCCAILHNLLIDINEEIPIEWLRDIDNGHYWTNDYDGNDETNNINNDRRQLVFDSYINDYYLN